MNAVPGSLIILALYAAWQPCGCIVTRKGGHTYTKFCPPCFAAFFASKMREPIYPAIQESREPDTAWLDK